MSLKSRISDTDQENIHLMRNINLYLGYTFSMVFCRRADKSHSAGTTLSTFLNYRDLTMHVAAEGMTTTADQISSLSLVYQYRWSEFPFLFDLFEFSLYSTLLSYAILEGTYNANYNEAIIESGNGSKGFMGLLKHGRWVSFNKFSRLNTTIVAGKNIGSGFSATASFHFQYYSFNKYNRLLKSRSLSNSILMGINYSF